MKKLKRFYPKIKIIIKRFQIKNTPFSFFCLLFFVAIFLQGCKTKNKEILLFFEKTKAGVCEWNTWRSDNPAIIPDLAGLYLYNQDLSGINLANCNLSGSRITRCKLERAVLFNVNFNNSYLQDTSFQNSDLKHASFHKSFAAGCNFSGVNLTGADFTQSMLGFADFLGAELSGIKFSRAFLKDAFFDDSASSQIFSRQQSKMIIPIPPDR